MPAPTAIHKWLRTPLGQDLRAIEARVISRALDQVFGVQLLQVGAWGKPGCLLEHARTQRRAILGESAGIGVSIVGDPAELGVATDSVDAVLLPHTLELSPEPHRVLREAERVLIGDGCLLILGFNPRSLWGLRRAFSRGRFPPGIQQFIAERRIRDWLALLGLEAGHAHHYLFVPPFRRRAAREVPAPGDPAGRAGFARHFAGAYLLVARKRVYTFTPIRPRWTGRRKVMGGLAEPTA
ncbi:MAG TPA: methyltransferase domain-containing protein [Gammaproteobacteria bacterium]|nr:methyltransferase domain-containing protein [Gammaproteobacteria bacterium]